MRVRSIHPRIVVPLISVMLITALLLLFISPFTHAQPANPRVTLSDSASAYTSKSQLLANTPVNQTISLAIGLNLRNTANLASYLREITDPHSPLYRHYLNPASFAALYGPLPQSEAAISAFLRSQGFKITATYPNHLIIDAVGTVAQAQHAFQVQINNYRSTAGQLFFANANPPSLPVQLAPLVARSVDSITLYNIIAIPWPLGRRPYTLELFLLLHLLRPQLPWSVLNQAHL